MVNPVEPANIRVLVAILQPAPVRGCDFCSNFVKLEDKNWLIVFDPSQVRGVDYFDKLCSTYDLFAHLLMKIM